MYKGYTALFRSPFLRASLQKRVYRGALKLVGMKLKLCIVGIAFWLSAFESPVFAGESPVIFSSTQLILRVSNQLENPEQETLPGEKEDSQKRRPSANDAVEVSIEAEVLSPQSYAEKGIDLSGYQPQAGVLVISKQLASQWYYPDYVLSPADLIFLSGRGRVIAVLKDEEIDSYAPDFLEKKPVVAVLNMGAGSIERLNIKPGDSIKGQIFNTLGSGVLPVPIGQQPNTPPSAITVQKIGGSEGAINPPPAPKIIQ
jgi:uncharacterized membrane protein (UPF0127 family)